MGSARHLVRNITEYPIKHGLFVDECYDIGQVENAHFWPFGVAVDLELHSRDGFLPDLKGSSGQRTRRATVSD